MALDSSSIAYVDRANIGYVENASPHSLDKSYAPIFVYLEGNLYDNGRIKAHFKGNVLDQDLSEEIDSFEGEYVSSPHKLPDKIKGSFTNLKTWERTEFTGTMYRYKIFPEGNGEYTFPGQITTTSGEHYNIFISLEA